VIGTTRRERKSEAARRRVVVVMGVILTQKSPENPEALGAFVAFRGS
jgi:hypothetical protein